MKTYKRIFNETFDSQRSVYDIVEAIIKQIETPIKRALKEYVELGNNSTTVKQYYSHYINDFGKFSFGFSMVSLLDKLNLHDSIFIDIRNFYKNHKYASLGITFDKNIKNNTAVYKGDGKSINVITGSRNYDDFIREINKKNYKQCFFYITYSNKLTDLLIHEFTHLYDDVISKEKAVSKKSGYKSAGEDVTAYLQNPIEINARFYPAVYGASRIKLQALSNQKMLKRVWDRNYLPAVEKELYMGRLTQEQNKRLHKRLWVEFTKLDKYEEEFLMYESLKSMINNGNIKNIDMRINDKKKVVNILKNMFVDLSKKKIGKNLFNSVEPFDNEVWQKDMYTQTEYDKQIVRNTKWAEADAFYALYTVISKANNDGYYKALLQSLVLSLRFDEGIIEKIKLNYNIIG